MPSDSVGEAKQRNVLFKEMFDRKRLIKAAVHRNNPVILDIGAHHGESARLFRDLFPGAFILSVEPDPGSFVVLIGAGADHCVNKAVSNNAGKVTLWRNHASHLNSLFPVNYESRDSIAFTKAREAGDERVFDTFNDPKTVEAITLDMVIPLLPFLPIDLLKIDVQGAEALVLEGGPLALAATDAVLVEISLYDFYEKHASFSDVEKFLHPAGLELFCLTEISHNPMNGRTDWVEALYTRR